MKTIAKAAVIGLILLIAAVTLTAGCVQTGDENTPAAPSSSTEPAGPASEPTTEPADEQATQEPSQVLDPDMPIVGNWKGTFTSDSGEVTLAYHFDKNHTGTLTTETSTSGKSVSGIHWLYDEGENAYIINYDKLGKQEYMIIILNDNKYYLHSRDGGYTCPRVE